eukprot:jgi/Chrzof1/13515/Cz08g00200.t1_NYC1[v5.2]
MVLFSAYVLGAVSSLAGLPTVTPALTGAALGGMFAMLDRYCKARLWRPPSSPLNIVITGGTKGLGKALTREFLQQGDSVVITGRTQESITKAVSDLSSEVECGINVTGVICDVGNSEDVAKLAEQAQQLLGNIDVWICNAGCSGSFRPFLDASDATISQVVHTNLLGAMLCSREAARVMMHQPLGGHIFFMDGAGSDGFATPQYAAYGATKAALPQLASTLGVELQDTPVGVHVLSPGMMLTDLLLEGATVPNKQVFNILCEHPETVAAFLVPRVKTAVARGLRGTYTKYLTPASALHRFMTAPSRLGRFFDKDGNTVYAAEHERIMGKGAKATARRQAEARARTAGLRLAYSLSLAISVVALVLDASKVTPAN